MKKLEKMLFEGIENNDLRKVALALNLGADVNLKNKFGSAPLAWAVCRDNITMVKLLISAGADVNAKNKWGTPLHWAVDVGHKELQDLLKQHGATL